MSLKRANYSYRIGLKLFKEGKLETALTHLNKALEILPIYSEVLSDKGAILVRLERYDEALEALNRALKFSPNLKSAIINKNFVLKKLETSTLLKFPLPDLLLNEVMKDEEEVKKKHKENIDKMRILYDEDYGKDPNTFYSAQFVGPINLLSVEELLFFKSLGVNPEDNMAIIKMGIKLNQKRNYAKALKLYDIALKLDSSDPNAWFGKGSVLYEFKKFKESLDCYNSAIESEPDYSYAWYGKGTALLKLNRFEEALECFNKSIEINPTYFSAYANKVFTLLKLKRFKEAIPFLDAATEMDPTYFESWYGDALKYIDSALVIDPKNSEYLSAKAHMLAKEKKIEKTIKSTKQPLSFQQYRKTLKKEE